MKWRDAQLRITSWEELHIVLFNEYEKASYEDRKKDAEKFFFLAGIANQHVLRDQEERLKHYRFMAMQELMKS